MSEPNWRELGDPWADRLPPRPRTKPVDPVIAWVGDVAVIHGERDDSEMCLCGAPDYLTCPDWIAGNGTVSSLTFTSATCYYSLGHRNRHQCDCVCVRPAGHNGPHQCSAEAVQP